jgi:hypothetical protein
MYGGLPSLLVPAVIPCSAAVVGGFIGAFALLFPIIILLWVVRALMWAVGLKTLFDMAGITVYADATVHKARHETVSTIRKVLESPTSASGRGSGSR